MKRKVFASKETKDKADKKPKKKIEVYSFFPNDKASCLCQPMVLEWKKRLATMNIEENNALVETTQYLVCPKSKEGYKRYEIKCANCKEVVGYCWASDETLTDFFDFHYTQWSDGIEWFGCLTPQISPITQKLCLECVCGADTRDFRANATLSDEAIADIERENSVGRDFGTKDSKFEVRQVDDDVLPFG